MTGLNDYKTYSLDEWQADEIRIHQATDWKARNFKEVDTGKEMEFPICIHRYGKPTETRMAKFHLFVRANPVFPPYWGVVEKDLPNGVLGGMYDGDVVDCYHVHNRFEDQKVYDILSI